MVWRAPVHCVVRGSSRNAGTGCIMPLAHSVFCQLCNIRFVVLARHAVREEASVLRLHAPHEAEALLPRRAARALDERLARLVLLEWPAVLDEPRDAQQPTVDERILEEERAVLVEPMPRVHDEH